MRFEKCLLRGIARTLDFAQPAERRAYCEILERNHEFGEGRQVAALGAFDDGDVWLLGHGNPNTRCTVNKTPSGWYGYRQGVNVFVSRFGPKDTSPSSQERTCLRTAGSLRQRLSECRQPRTTSGTGLSDATRNRP